MIESAWPRIWWNHRLQQLMQRNLAALLVLVLLACASCAPTSSTGDADGGRQAFDGIVLPGGGPICMTLRRGVGGMVADTTIQSDPLAKPGGAGLTLVAGTEPGSPAKSTSALLRFDLAPVPAGVTIASARVTLNQKAGTAGTIDVFAATSTWDEATATQSSFGGAFVAPPATSFPNAGAAFSGFVQFDATGLVTKWYAGQAPNDGFVLQQAVGTTGFWSSEQQVIFLRPRLVVCYTAGSTCSNGVVDGDETGIDCGGHCPTCDLCSKVDCAPIDACHGAGACDPATGLCSNPLKADGTACDDGSVCTSADSCDKGVCVGSSAVTCPPSDDCHGVGECDAATGTCSSPSAVDDTPCDDNNPCTNGDSCSDGVCAGGELACSVPNGSCFINMCDPATGACSIVIPVQDGHPCWESDACQTSSCQSGACTSVNTVVCTVADSCHVAGVCDPATGICSMPTVAADGLPCDDMNSCTQPDSCQGGVCVGSNPVQCTAPDQCHLVGACDPMTGACSNPSLVDGTPCSNGDVCSDYESCQLGACELTAKPISWQTGTLGLLPGGLISKVIKKPCYTGADCQANTYCGEPATGAACAHDKCAPGAPLNASCDPCVQQICAKPANATCCASATCAHDVCAIGAKLASACDPCVNSICSTNPNCCTSAWDATCVGLVTSQCGKTCGKWSSACVQEVHDTCDAFCKPPLAACAHDTCSSGSPLVDHCDDNVPGGDCVKNICAMRASCCATAWDPTCVSLIPTACGKACATTGVCKPWTPLQADPECGEADLTLGVPCASQIPVCNVGTMAAVPPAGGIIVHRWPSNASGMPTCSPNLATGVDCPPLMQTIPPGHCVMLSCAVSGNDELMVNPSGSVSECTCQNNWSVNSTAAVCTPASCSGPQSTYLTTNIVWHIGMERSSATSAAILPATTVLAQVKLGLNSFYTSPINATAHGTLTFFPDSPTAPATQPDCNTTTCTSATTCTPRVTMNLLNSSLFTTAVTAATSAAGGPPTSAAYDGMITTAIPFTTVASYLNDTHIAVLVLSSDVANCNPSVTALATAAAAALANSKIHTFVIGIGVPFTTTAAIATAGGGKAFDLSPNALLGANITLALNSIRQTLFPCTFPLPPTGAFDPSSPAVTYIHGAPGPVMSDSEPLVQNLAACLPTGGVYYDNNANPTQVIACPVVCLAHQTTLYSAIQLNIGCLDKCATIPVY